MQTLCDILPMPCWVHGAKTKNGHLAQGQGQAQWSFSFAWLLAGVFGRGKSRLLASWHWLSRFEQNSTTVFLFASLLNFLVAIFAACLIVSIGIMILFFTDYIYNLKGNIRDKTQPIQYFKWIILGFLLNIIFLILLNSMKSYKNNIIRNRHQ